MAERVKYEKRELLPLAGLDASGAEQYYRVQKLIDQASYAGNEAARRKCSANFSRRRACHRH